MLWRECKFNYVFFGISHRYSTRVQRVEFLASRNNEAAASIHSCGWSTTGQQDAEPPRPRSLLRGVGLGDDVRPVRKGRHPVRRGALHRPRAVLRLRRPALPGARRADVVFKESYGNTAVCFIWGNRAISP